MPTNPPPGSTAAIREALEALRVVIESRSVDYDRAAVKTGEVSYAARANEAHDILRIIDIQIASLSPEAAPGFCKNFDPEAGATCRERTSDHDAWCDGCEAAPVPAAMPLIEVGDWVIFNGARVPGVVSSADNWGWSKNVVEIRKANGVIWRRSEEQPQ